MCEPNERIIEENTIEWIELNQWLNVPFSILLMMIWVNGDWIGLKNRLQMYNSRKIQLTSNDYHYWSMCRKKHSRKNILAAHRIHRGFRWISKLLLTFSKHVLLNVGHSNESLGFVFAIFVALLMSSLFFLAVRMMFIVHSR